MTRRRPSRPRCEGAPLPAEDDGAPQGLPGIDELAELAGVAPIGRDEAEGRAVSLLGARGWYDFTELLAGALRRGVGGPDRKIFACRACRFVFDGTELDGCPHCAAGSRFAVPVWPDAPRA